MSLNLHSTGKNSSHPELMEMSEYLNLTNFNPNILNTAKSKHFISYIAIKLFNILKN